MRALRKLGSSSGFWSVTDQAAVSLGNFLTQIVLARHFGLREYGIFALIFSVLLFLNSFHAGLIIYPLTVRGAESDDSGLRSLTSSCLLFTAWLVVPESVVIVVAAWALHVGMLVPWIVAALILWQLQETLRRAFMAHLRHREAIVGDIVSYMGQALLLIVLARGPHLTLAAAFATIAASSLAGIVIQCYQLGLSSPAFRNSTALFKRITKSGRWVCLDNGITALTLLAFPWILSAISGPAAAAPFQALVNILGVGHPVMWSVGNLIVPATAKARINGGVRTASMWAVKYGMEGAVLLVPYYGILMFWPKLALTAFYGNHSVYLELQLALRVFVVAYLFAYLAQVMAALLNGMEHSRSVFLSQVMATVAALALVVPLIAWQGVVGACTGYLTMTLTRSAASAFFVARL